MKKIIFTALAVFSFTFAQAQEVSFGAKAGLNISNASFSGGNVPSSNSKIGVHLGGFAQLKMSDKFALQGELLFSTQGFKTKVVDVITLTTQEVDYKLNYLNVPIMAQYYVIDKLALEAGPQIGVLLSAKGEVSGNTQDIKDNVKSIDFGLNLGASYNVTDNILVGARYNLGLADTDDDATSGDLKVYNRVLQFSVGYKF